MAAKPHLTGAAAGREPIMYGDQHFIEQGVQRNAPLLLYDLAFRLTPVLLAGRVLHDRLAVTTV